VYDNVGTDVSELLDDKDEESVTEMLDINNFLEVKLYESLKQTIQDSDSLDEKLSDYVKGLYDMVSQKLQELCSELQETAADTEDEDNHTVAQLLKSYKD
jgi:hypothetical protein